MKPLMTVTSAICAGTILVSCAAPTQREIDELRGSAAPSASTSASSAKPSNSQSASESSQVEKTTQEKTAQERNAQDQAAQNQAGNVTVTEFQLDDLKVDSSTTLPVRGYLATSSKPNSPLVILSHLRSFNCADSTFAYPCPKGIDEVRLDKGMVYAAKALAGSGYTVVVPDLGPLWAPDDQTQPYDQEKAWMDTLTEIRNVLEQANEGKKTALGKGLKGSTDMKHTGIFLHSRSAIVGNQAAKAWPGVSLVSYGGFFVLPETDEDDFAPAPADVPLLAIDGLADQDVSQAAASWLPEYVDQDRKHAALAVLVPGLGHNFINQTLSERGFDDRVEEDLATPKEHEEFLSTVLNQWFDQTLKGKSGPFPQKAEDKLPEKVGGRDARVFALTPSSSKEKPSRWVATEKGEQLSGVEATYCRNYPLMNPIQYEDRCKMVDRGVVNAPFVNARFMLSKSPVVVPVAKDSADSVIIHVMPTGSRVDDKKETTMSVSVVLSDGRKVSVKVPETNQALQDRKSQNNNGTYWIETLRLPLPPEARNKSISRVELSGQGSIDLRSVELY